jgi:hypothetical protein
MSVVADTRSPIQFYPRKEETAPWMRKSASPANQVNLNYIDSSLLSGPLDLNQPNQDRGYTEHTGVVAKAVDCL